MTNQLNSSGERRASRAAADDTQPAAADSPEAVARARATAPLPAADIAESAGDGDPDEADEATVLRPSVKTAAQGPARKHTLSAAITRPVQPADQEAARSAGRDTPVLSSPATQAVPAAHAEVPRAAVPDEIEDEADEWATADQPTVYLPPRRAMRSARPDAPAPRPAAVAHPAPAPAVQDPRLPPASRPQPPRTLGQTVRPDGPSVLGPRRYASPTGRPMPATPPEGISRAALPDPRMQRFQELRQRRLAYLGGQAQPDGAKPVAETVRQWWGDLMPGLRSALNYQHEARASGVHPIPPHVPSAASRLGDAFGRLTASARELTSRAQAAMAPAIKRLTEQAERLHDQAEHRVDAIVDKLEGAAPVRQQGPLLGPGRIAVFFHQGVSVSQAQSLLAANRARPIRLIPRKHGFLALVPPGAEAAVAEHLRQHEFIRDVEYLQFDEYGQPTEQP